MYSSMKKVLETMLPSCTNNGPSRSNIRVDSRSPGKPPANCSKFAASKYRVVNAARFSASAINGFRKNVFGSDVYSSSTGSALQHLDSRRHLSACLGPGLARGGAFVDAAQPLHDARRLRVVAVIRLRQRQRIAEIETVDVAERIGVAGNPLETPEMPLEGERRELHAAFRFGKFLRREFVEHCLAPCDAPRLE